MTKIREQILTTGQAKHLTKLGFIVKFIEYTLSGIRFSIWVK